MRVGGLINYISNQNSAMINVLLKPYGISHGEARVIFFLHNYNDLYQDKLTKMLQIDKSAVTRILKNMETKGLIKREISKIDRRNHQIVLSKQGKELYKIVDDVFATASHKMLKGIDESRQALLSEVLEHVARNMEETQ